MPKKYNVFFVSDGTGLTVQSYGKTLLSQFPCLQFNAVTLSFIDTTEKALGAREQINTITRESKIPSVVFSTLLDDNDQYIISSSNACVINLFNTFVSTLENFFGMESAHKCGNTRMVFGDESYQVRLDAIDFALSHDDGLMPDQYQDADVILAGVSRCGKTPTSLYLAMNFSLKAANYPLTSEDLVSKTLPDCLLDQRHKLVGLMIKPVPLSRIRRQRRPNSEYASLEVCQHELEIAKALFDHAAIPVFDTTDTSIEEISGAVIKVLKLGRANAAFVTT